MNRRPGSGGAVAVPEEERVGGHKVLHSGG
jgi:hypothetical protein